MFKKELEIDDLSNDHFAFYLRLGETSAGKNSMLNLILGEELLPFSVLSTTSTICELKYGGEKRIKIHYKEEGKAPEITHLNESSPYIDQISEFVHVKSASLREKASSYKKVELFWPHRLLQVRSSKPPLYKYNVNWLLNFRTLLKGLVPNGQKKYRQKINLFTLFPQQDGVGIVDSPGIGESKIMDEIALNYLPNAFAFIHVINSSNAGGGEQ